MTFLSLHHESCFSQVIFTSHRSTSALMEELMLFNFSTSGESLSFSVHSQSMIFLFYAFSKYKYSLFLPAT